MGPTGMTRVMTGPAGAPALAASSPSDISNHKCARTAPSLRTAGLSVVMEHFMDVRLAISYLFKTKKSV